MATLKSVVGKRAFSLGSKVTPELQKLANDQTVVDLTKQPANVAVTAVNKNTVANFMPIPESVTVEVENTGDAAADIFLFNLDVFKTNSEDIVIDINDGFNGKLINQLIRGLMNSNGLVCYGFNITGYGADEIKSDKVVNKSQMQVRYYNGDGDSYVPVPIKVAGSERNTQYKDGLLTVKTQFVLNFLSQYKLRLGAGESMELVFFFQPIVD